MFLAASLKCLETGPGEVGPWIEACRTLACIPTDVARITTLIYNILKIAAPLVLIIVGMFDMARAVAAGKEDEIKKAQGLLVKKAISAALVFLLLSLITFVFNILSNNDQSAQSVIKCVNVLLNNDGTKNWQLQADCPHGGANYEYYATEEECNHGCEIRRTNQGCSCTCQPTR